MFIQGIKRTKHQYSWIYDIEEVKCCHPKSETPSYEHCYEKNDRTLRHYEGWMFCAKDYFLVGLYRAECSGEPCSERFKCCTFIPRGTVNMIIFQLTSFSIVTQSKKCRVIRWKRLRETKTHAWTNAVVWLASCTCVEPYYQGIVRQPWTGILTFLGSISMAEPTLVEVGFSRDYYLCPCQICRDMHVTRCMLPSISITRCPLAFFVIFTITSGEKYGE